MELICLKTSEDTYQQALTLRYDLFFREPGLPKDILFDELEESSVHVAMVAENGLYMYGRISPQCLAR
ncbi:MAG: hypothetical protein ACI9T7_001586 [Oleiphilaceae bacterium]|jgi:hypothetical protein